LNRYMEFYKMSFYCILRKIKSNCNNKWWLAFMVKWGKQRVVGTADTQECEFHYSNMMRTMYIKGHIVQEGFLLFFLLWIKGFGS
jgi:hypothetical protein